SPPAPARSETARSSSGTWTRWCASAPANSTPTPCNQPPVAAEPRSAGIRRFPQSARDISRAWLGPTVRLQLDPVAPVRLGPVQRRVRARDQVLQVRVLRHQL